jgi:hypothetical protein
MATCVNCGRWAGIGSTRHDECESVAPPSELAAELRPLLMAAATRAGITAAVTFVGISVAGGLLYFLLVAIFSNA